MVTLMGALAATSGRTYPPRLPPRLPPRPLQRNTLLASRLQRLLILLTGKLLHQLSERRWLGCRRR